MSAVLLSISIAMATGLLLTRLRVFKKFNLPDVTAYLIAGVLIGPCIFGRLTVFIGVPGLGFQSYEELDGIGVISDVALGFIAFSIGNEFRLSQLRETGKQATVIGIIQAVVATLVTDIGLMIIHFIRPDVLSAPAAITLGAIAAATAPAATLMVVRQYKAKGPLVDILLPIVALDDAVGLVLFAVSFGIAKALKTGSPDVVSIIVNPIIEIGVSLLLGAVAGYALTKIEAKFNSNTNRLVMTISFVFLTVAISMLKFKAGPVTIGFSPLLVCMMLGSVFCNMCPLSGEIMKVADGWTGPILELFFVISGAQLDLTVFSKYMAVVIGIAYTLFRAMGKYYGTKYSAKTVKCSKSIEKYLGITLLPQAGVALGMCVTAANLPGDGDLIRNIVLFSVLINQLVGPSLTKWALTKAGDIRPQSDETLHRRERKLDEAQKKGAQPRT
ncbi:MAG: cation:proton antiporter [Clostridia bacterium]|nr:cation:proton antiporter [Clostridia bacterium]